ncbi:MAG: hypothetical protein KA207_02790 [Burkholderiaceae bacterium]|nr:hypothetical protein [Burkholderiaceae bacterium]
MLSNQKAKSPGGTGLNANQRTLNNRSYFSSYKKKGKKLSAMEKALRAISRKPQGDRERSFHPFAESCLLVDDSGGEDILSFSEAVACHHFLVWFRAEQKLREATAEQRQAVYRRRSALKLVGGVK